MIFLVFVFGAILGSFVNVLILRLPKNEKMTGRSRCPHCQHQLAAIDLIPVLSFIMLRGRCRYCGKEISWRYIFIELLCAALLAAAYAKFISADLAVPSPLEFFQFARAGFILLTMVLVFAIDFEHYLILDKVIFPASFILLFLNFMVDVFSGHKFSGSLSIAGLLSAAALLVFFGSIYYLSRGRWLGFGDVKLGLLLGLATPYPFIIITIFLSFLIGTIASLFLLAARRKTLTSQVPFGTFLALSCALVIFYGPLLLNIYLKTLGLWYLATY